MRRYLHHSKNLIIDLIDWFHKPFSKFIPEVTFRYAVTGGANTALDIFLYFIFYQFVFAQSNVDLGVIVLSPHIAAFVFVFPITFTTGFILAKYVTFTQSTLKGRIQLFRYGLTVGGSILLNYALLKLFVEVFYMQAVLAKVLTTLIVIAYSYVAQRYFTFHYKIKN